MHLKASWQENRKFENAVEYGIFRCRPTGHLFWVMTVASGQCTRTWLCQSRRNHIPLEDTYSGKYAFKE